MITFQQETLDQSLGEMKPLFEKHYKEIAMYQDKIELNPDYDRYYELEKNGGLQIYTARDDEKLIGYTIYFTNKHLHYKDHLYAANDIIYVDPEYRGSLMAFDLLHFADEQLKELGVSVVTMHMKSYAPFETLMKACEYDKAEFIYSKYIGV